VDLAAIFMDLTQSTVD